MLTTFLSRPLSLPHSTMNVWRSPGRYTDDSPFRARTTPFPFRLPAGDKLPRLGLSRVVRIYRTPNSTSRLSSDSLVNVLSIPPVVSTPPSSTPSKPTESLRKEGTSMENLNDIPMELRPLAPFLQRAQELKLKDPTMSYWCEYPSPCLQALVAAVRAVSKMSDELR